MRQATAKHLRAMCKDLKSDRKFAYKQAKKDYNLTPWKEKSKFSIFEPQTEPNT